MKEFQENQKVLTKAISKLEGLIGADAFYDSDLGGGIASLTDTAYTAIEEAYGLPSGDIEWLESVKWLEGKEQLYTQGRGVVLLDSLDKYVEVVFGE